MPTIKYLNVSLKELINEPFSKVICYPRSSEVEIKRRIKELKNLKINKIIFDGKTEINGLKVLGKGWVGIVINVLISNKIYVIKIRRVDSNRISMNNEVKLHKTANLHNIGPQIHFYSKNFIVMEYIKGEEISKWISQIKDIDKKQIKNILLNLLDQCFTMDINGLDHGELSNMKRHVIINNKANIIDFESASTKRRTSNVTSVCQYLFVGNKNSSIIRKILKIKSKNGIIKILKKYKNDKNRLNYMELLSELNIL